MDMNDPADTRWDWRWALLRGGLAPSSTAGAAPSEWLLKAHDGLWTEAVAGTGVGHELKHSAGGLWMCIPEAALLEEAERRWAAEAGGDGLLSANVAADATAAQVSDGLDEVGASQGKALKRERQLGEMHDALLAIARADGWDGGQFSMGGIGGGGSAPQDRKTGPVGQINRTGDALIAEAGVAGSGDPLARDEEAHESAILHAVALRRMVPKLAERIWRATRGASDPAAFVAAAR